MNLNWVYFPMHPDSRQCTDILSALALAIAGKYWFCGVTTDGASISKACGGGGGGCKTAAADSQELYALWVEVTTCSCWKSVEWCCSPRSPHHILLHTSMCFGLTQLVLCFTNCCSACLHICITGIVFFPTMQPVSVFLIFYLPTTDGAAISQSFSSSIC